MTRLSVFLTPCFFRSALALAFLHQVTVSGQVGLALENAVQHALTSHTAIRVSEADTQSALADLSAASQVFAPRVRAFAQYAREQTALGPDIDRSGDRFLKHTLDAGLVAERTLRSGIRLSTEVFLSRAGLPPLQASSDETANIHLQVALPLISGRGGGFAAVAEHAAGRYHDSTRASLQHTAAAVAFTAISAYWHYRAAHKRAEVYLGSEKRAQRLADDTRVLIQADERPRSDFDLIAANLASKRAVRLLAEQRVQDALHELGLAMGATSEAMMAWGPPTTDFPKARAAEAPLSPPQAAATALDRRDDLRAALARQGAAEILRDRARRELKPRLDFHVTGIYERQLRSFGAAASPQPFSGLGTSWQIVYEPLMGLVDVRSRALRTEADYARGQAATEDLRRRVSSEAALAAKAVDSSVQEMAAVEEAVRRSLAAVETEEKKFHVGLATVFDAILAADTLSNALISEIDARARFAVARARLRFETGTLLVFDGSAARLDFASIL